MTNNSIINALLTSDDDSESNKTEPTKSKKNETIISALTNSYDGTISDNIISELKDDLDALESISEQDTIPEFTDKIKTHFPELKIFHDTHLRKKLSNIDKSLGEINSTLATIKSIIVFLLILFIIGIVISAFN